MKKVKRLVAAIALALALVLSSVAMCACGGGAHLDKGSYEGTYKITFTDGGETKYYGCTAKFDVDDNNCIWSVENSAPAADWSGAAADETYTAPAIATGAPWNPNKAKSQFSGWTVEEIMQITVDVDANGRPAGKGCIHSDKEVTVWVDCDEGMAFLILAIQNAVTSNAQ